MTRKHKPQTAHTHKKRSPAHSGKPMRPASDKAVAALASLRERERPRNGPLLASEPSAPADEEAIEEAAAALAALDAELGRTTDPVRMYMREMGTVELLTREGEIRIAKRIEEGLDAVRSALAMYPPTYDFLLRAYEPVKAGQARLVDVIVGFIDPNAPDVIAQPQNPTKVELPTAAEKNDDEEETDGEAESEEEAIDTGPDPAEEIGRAHV